VRLLLDTHIALWAIADHPNLSPKARRLIGEIAIKHSLARGGPNDMPISGQEALGYFRDAGFELLDIAPAHAAAVETLAPLHADLFDRMLVAQALTTPLRLLTHDQRVAAYSDTVITD
jgi:PIN domain nuclease of toxin-antitoxin system